MHARQEATTEGVATASDIQHLCARDRWQLQQQQQQYQQVSSHLQYTR
jgi:hypothetical protein